MLLPLPLLLLHCFVVGLRVYGVVRGGPETEAQPLSNTKHQTPKQQKPKKNPAQSGGQTKLSYTLRCYNTFNALRQILQNFTKISFNVFGNICRY